MSSRNLLCVAFHGPVDDVGKVSLEDSHRFSFDVASGAGVVEECSCAWLEAELDHCHAVETGVEFSVPAA
jgi:hypothetical protein